MTLYSSQGGLHSGDDEDNGDEETIFDFSKTSSVKKHFIHPLRSHSHNTSSLFEGF